MLAYVREVGAMPFILFEYYLTYETAPDGIRPSLETIAKDLRLFDKKGNPSKTAVCNLKKVLIDEKWIKEENGRIIILKSFRNSEHHSENLNDLSENLNEDSEILNGTDVANKGFTSEKEKENKKKKDIYSAHETFSPSDSDLTDLDFAAQIDETLLWLRQKKNLKRLPQSEWIALFTDLEAEDITLDKFKEFYLWVENLDWVTGIVTVKLLRGQIEAYKNREHFEAKKIIKGKNGNAGIQQSGKQYQNPKLAKDEYALRELEFSERNRREVERELDALRKKDGDDR